MQRPAGGSAGLASSSGSKKKRSFPKSAPKPYAPDDEEEEFDPDEPASYEEGDNDYGEFIEQLRKDANDKKSVRAHVSAATTRFELQVRFPLRFS